MNMYGITNDETLDVLSALADEIKAEDERLETLSALADEIREEDELAWQTR